MDVISEAKDDLETEEPIINSIENRSLVEEKYLIHHQKQEAAVDPLLSTPEKPRTPMNFSTVTVEQLGITPDSFVKNSPGKSSLLKKSRRRSTIGVRGSPETNLLIRYIAQQRNLKNASESPLAVTSSIQQASPFRNRNGDSLRERISAFQSAFHPVKENEGKPGQSGPEGEFQAADCTKNKSPKRCDQPKLCGELPSKRRRISYQRDLKENIADGEKKLTDIQICHIATFPDLNRTCSTRETSTTDHSKESSLDPSVVAQSGCLLLEDTPQKGLSGATRGTNVTECAVGESASNGASRHRGRRSKSEKELSPETLNEIMPPIAPAYRGDLSSCESSFLRSVLKKTPVKLLLESLQEHCDTTGYGGNQPFSFSELSKGCEELKNDRSGFKVQKAWHRKRVTFGEELSPEVFDESLPANTPLRKGGTPARQRDVRDLHPPFFPRLSISEAISQPTFDESEEDLVNMEPLEVSFAVLGPAVNSSSSETLEDTDAVNSQSKCEKTSPPKLDRITRSSSKRKQLDDIAEETDFSNLVSIDVKNNKERKLSRKKTQGIKNTNKTASKKIHVLKNCRRRKGKGKRLQKSFYGQREVASKKPLLSPIPEIPESPSTTAAAAQRMPMLWCSDHLDLPKDDYNSYRERDEDAINSSGTHQPVGRPRNKYLPKNPETLHVSQVYEENNSPEGCFDLPLCPISFEENSTVSAKATYGSGHGQHAPKQESQEHLKKRTKTQNVCLLSPALPLSTEEEAAPAVPDPSFILLQPLNSAEVSPNVEGVCESEGFASAQPADDQSTLCEKQRDAFVAFEGRLATSHLGTSEREVTSPEDTDTNEDVEQTQSHSEELNRKNPKTNSGTLAYKNLLKKQRRSSIYCPGDQRCHSEETGNQQPSSCPMEDAHLDNSELFDSLTDSIKQAFKRLSTAGAKVRRSTRLQRNSENHGLIWVSLPGPSTSSSCASHKAKRRTVCTASTREFEDLSQDQGPCILSSLSNSENDSTSGPPHVARRKSFCASTLSETKSASRPKYYRRTSLSHRIEDSRPNDFEKMEVPENPSNI